MALPPELQQAYADCLAYIEAYWDQVTFFDRKDHGIFIGLPHPYVSPNANIYKYDLFYWDSYFTIAGLTVSRRISLAKGMVNNFAYLFKKFTIMPHRNRMYNLGTSQPPFFTSMIREVFSKDEDKRWLRKMARVAEAELEATWMNPHAAEGRYIYKGLSRYSDHFITNSTAEHESGWDLTSRFSDRCLDILPVDLNCCLYKYEKDLAHIYGLLNDPGRVEHYTAQAEKRRQTINELFWDEERGFFFDFDHRHETRRDFWSLAGFYPLWSGLATPAQAERLTENLSRFEENGGLANSTRAGLLEPYRQWDYPNGWPNNHFIVIKGLIAYGYRQDAERIGRKWLDVIAKVYRETGRIWEKYDVVRCDIGRSGAYPTQDGFSWTNASFVRILDELYGNH